jgi:hypothetical protein
LARRGNSKRGKYGCRAQFIGKVHEVPCFGLMAVGTRSFFIAEMHFRGKLNLPAGSLTIYYEDGTSPRFCLRRVLCSVLRPPHSPH